MPGSSDKQKTLEDIIRSDGRYPPEAFGFLLNEGLPRAVRDSYGRRAAGKGEGSPKARVSQAERARLSEHAPRHVTGRQLCLSLRDLAIEKWGMLAPVVLEKWNIRSTLDFGNMVYLLIENNMMAKTAEDSIEDFRDVYGFAEAFKFDQDLRLKG